jgi:hypothetical protein
MLPETVARRVATIRKQREASESLAVESLDGAEAVELASLRAVTSIAEQATRSKAQADASRAARATRIGLMWRRLLQRVSPERRVELREHRSIGRRIGILRAVIATNPPPGWFFRSMVEAADLGLEDLWEQRYSPRAPKRPTSAMPGSPAKIAVLMARVAAGEHLYHPDDKASYDGGE